MAVVTHTAQAAGIEANVIAIIDKLPEEREQKMKSFDQTVKEYIESVDWLEDDDEIPLKVTIQLFLSENPSNVEDRYNCEFLISSTDVQYFDRRVRFAYEPGDPLLYSEQSIDALTGVINFYVNMVLGSELDKYRTLGGDLYYKRALDFASLGKFVRTEFITGWTERDELIKRVLREPFITFRKMKDYYFYGLYLLQEENNPKEALRSILTALDLLEKVTATAKSDMEEHKQFVSAHHTELVDIFKDYTDRNQVFQRLIALDPDHRNIYQKHLTGF